MDADDTRLTQAERQYPLPPSTLDARNYTDLGQHARELTEVFPHSWLPVGPSSDVATPRSFTVWDHVGQSVVVVRQDDGSLAAFHNVCQHRGARLVREPGICERGQFRCPWHGFGYGLDGSVTAVPLRPTFDQRELEGLGIPRVRCEEWAGWVWITLSDAAPALRPYLGVIADELDWYGLDDFRVTHRQAVRLTANWKIVMDGFLETWHVPFTHKDSLASYVLWREAVLHIEEPHSWMSIPVRGYTEQREGLGHQASMICHYLAFPNTIYSCFPTHLQMWSTWPISPLESEMVAFQLEGPAPEGVDMEKWNERRARDWMQFVGVLEEDMQVINDSATVINSLGFRRSLFSTAESRLTAFHEQLNRRTVGPTPEAV
jgi:choline monooxygenase